MLPILTLTFAYSSGRALSGGGRTCFILIADTNNQLVRGRHGEYHPIFSRPRGCQSSFGFDTDPSGNSHKIQAEIQRDSQRCLHGETENGGAHLCNRRLATELIFLSSFTVTVNVV